MQKFELRIYAPVRAKNDLQGLKRMVEFWADDRDDAADKASQMPLSDLDADDKVFVFDERGDQISVLRP